MRTLPKLVPTNGYRTDKRTEIERICIAFYLVFPVRLILSGTVLLLLSIRSVHLKILGFPIGGAY